MTKMVAAPIAAVLATTVALLGLWAIGGQESAQAQSTVNFDIDPEISGNSANTLGTIEDCVRVDGWGGFDGVADHIIDIVVTGDTRAPMAYDAWVTYDSTVIRVVAADPLIKVPGATDLSEGLPDSDGEFRATAAYPIGGPGMAGDGTILRIGLDINFDAGPPIITFGFAQAGYSSAAGAHATTTGTGHLAINTDCLVNFDIDPETTGNSATTLGMVEDCDRVDGSGGFDGSPDYTIDAVVQVDTRPPLGYDAWVTYDSTVVRVVAADPLIKLAGAADFSDSLPDSDGEFRATAAYPIGGPGMAGDGTILRIGLDINFDAGPTVITFGFAQAAYSSAAGAHATTTGTGQLAINTNCPGRLGPDVYVLLVNGIAPGGNLRDHVAKDVDHLRAAFAHELRTVSITTLGGSVGADTPATPQDLEPAIAAAFGPSGANDLCIFYLGTHGSRTEDKNKDEDDGFDGAFQIGAFGRLDDNMDTPFNARLAAGDCQAGMILMFMACRSGELIVGGNDFALGAPHVVTTSCASSQGSRACVVGHNHSCYGGNGLVRGLTSDSGAPPARADGGGMDVTAAELHAYAVANDGDLTADPQSTAPASVLKALTYAAPAAHASPVQQEGFFCDSVPLEPEPVGGIVEMQVGDSDSAAGYAADSSGRSASPNYVAIAGLAAAAALGITAAGGWYARRRWLR